MQSTLSRISVHDVEAVDAMARRLRIDLQRVRQFRNAYFKRFESFAQAIEKLPEDVRETFADGVLGNTLSLDCQRDSQLDGATKLLFRTTLGYLIETVILRPSTGRTSLCVSSQVGCAANCRFCATGKMGVAHNLSASEILDQVILAARRVQRESRRVRNIVFMGMGEPLHNFAAVTEALTMLTSPNCFNHSPRRILLSTVGIPDRMVDLARQFPEINLALSLHSAREEVRQQIIPLAAIHPLDALHAALQEIAAQMAQPVMIEYLMLRDLTDTNGDLEALSRFLKGLNVHVNLIPYNAIEDAAELESSRPERQQEFSEELKSRGFTVTTRYSLGADIAAACGQLIQKENRQIAAAAARQKNVEIK